MLGYFSFLIVFLAKNRLGYHNLAKLSSHACIDGLYAGCPRIDKELLLQYQEGLIVTSGGLTAEIPDLILNVGVSQAEESFIWWHQTFGDDFYVELIRHGLDEEEHVNEVLLSFARKYGVKYFASNNVYYIDKEDAISSLLKLVLFLALEKLPFRKSTSEAVSYTHLTLPTKRIV